MKTNPFLPCNLSNATLVAIKAALLKDRSEQDRLRRGAFYPVNKAAWAKNLKHIDALVANINKILSP